MAAVPGPDAGAGPVDDGGRVPRDGGRPPPIEAGSPVRSIETRNPFGNTRLEQNLLVDGDFELTSSSGQFGWRAILAGQGVELVRETGGLCRSGVTCGVLTPGMSFLAFGAAAPGRAMEASFWAKPAEPDCEIVSGSVISCSSEIVFRVVRLQPRDQTPDARGWCEYRAGVPEMVEQPCLFLGMRASSTRVLIDDAALLPASGSGTNPLALSVPSPELRARMEQALAWLHRHRRFGRAAPSSP